MAIDVAADLGRILDDAAGPGLDAIYRQPLRWDLGVRVALLQAEPHSGLQDPNVRAGMVRISMPVGSIEMPASGDTIVIGAETYAVQGAPSLIARGSRWHLEAWPLDALALDTEITFERAVKTRNAFGEEAAGSEDWAPLGTAMASRTDISAAEQIRAGRVEVRNVAVFTCRTADAPADFDSADGIRQAGKAWGVVGVQRLARDAWLEITAERRT